SVRTSLSPCASRPSSRYCPTAARLLCTLALHDALPICDTLLLPAGKHIGVGVGLISQADTLQQFHSLGVGFFLLHQAQTHRRQGDRKSTRLNSSHVSISYAVFCLKEKIECDT